MQHVNELLRLPSPAPAPLGVAFDGEHLWLGSLETQRLYAMDPAQWTLSDEVAVPGKPFGIVPIGDDFRVVVGQGEADDRYIMRFVPGHGFKESAAVACPDFTGSHLAYDGKVLYLSQATTNRILELDERGDVVREIALERRPVGITFVDARLYVVAFADADEQRVLMSLDPGDTHPKAEELALIPFAARGLAFDGARFWTGERDANEIVAFTRVV